jgi:parallel beta-helix repeat protein
MDINGSAIILINSTGSNIIGNKIDRIGTVAGYGTDSASSMMAIYCSESDSITISENNVDSTGSCGIFTSFTNGLISKNILDHCLLHINDHTSLFMSSGVQSNCMAEDNFILNAVGSIEGSPAINTLTTSGIFVSDITSGITLARNTISFATKGIILSGGTSDNTLKQNLIYGCSESQLEIVEGSVEGSTINNVITGNIFYSLNENSDVVKLTSPFDDFSPAHFDSNYYFNPYNFYAFHTRLEPYDFYATLEQWKTKTLNDSSSKATFVAWHRFHPVDTLGDNLFSNGDFTNNFDGWNVTVANNMTMLLDNSTPLDGGCLKLIKNTGEFLDGSIFTQGISVDSNEYYLISTSNYSVKEGNVRIYLSMVDSPFLPLGLNRFFPFTSERRDYWTIFPASKSVPARFDVFIYYEDSIVWVDNFYLTQVAVNYEEPVKKSRLFLNPSSQAITIDLQDSVFFDLDQHLISGQLSLGPYSSAVLLFDSSLINTVTAIDLRGYFLFIQIQPLPEALSPSKWAANP